MTESQSAENQHTTSSDRALETVFTGEAEPDMEIICDGAGAAKPVLTAGVHLPDRMFLPVAGE